MAKVYVASSWRNQRQPEVVRALREAGHEVYDFKNPHATGPDRGRRGVGFSWREVDPNWQSWTTSQYLDALEHEAAVDGFESDMDALRWADACVLVMPCGRSAHLEAGWAQGSRRQLIILLDSGTPAEPELMYAMAYGICDTVDQVLAMLVENEGVPDEVAHHSKCECDRCSGVRHG